MNKRSVLGAAWLCCASLNIAHASAITFPDGRCNIPLDAVLPMNELNLTDLTEGDFDSRDYATVSVVPTMEIGVGNSKTFIVQPFYRQMEGGRWKGCPCDRARYGWI